MGAMILIYTSINRSFSKAVGACKGGLIFRKNDLSLAVLNIKAIKCTLWGMKCSNIFLSVPYVLLSVLTKLFAFTNLIPSFKN